MSYVLFPIYLEASGGYHDHVYKSFRGSKVFMENSGCAYPFLVCLCILLAVSHYQVQELIWSIEQFPWAAPTDR